MNAPTLAELEAAIDEVWRDYSAAKARGDQEAAARLCRVSNALVPQFEAAMQREGTQRQCQEVRP